MIKHTELRCGNLYDQFGNSHYVTPTIIADLEKAPKSQIWFKPIPLSEEWLLRAGFKHKMFTAADDDGVLRDKMAPNRECFDHDKLPKEVSLYLPYNHFSYYIGSVRVEFVHQLQNLYFALTGEELTFNEP